MNQKKNKTTTRSPRSLPARTTKNQNPNYCCSVPVRPTTDKREARVVQGTIIHQTTARPRRKVEILHLLRLLFPRLKMRQHPAADRTSRSWGSSFSLCVLSARKGSPSREREEQDPSKKKKLVGSWAECAAWILLAFGVLRSTASWRQRTIFSLSYSNYGQHSTSHHHHRFFFLLLFTLSLEQLAATSPGQHVDAVRNELVVLVLNLNHEFATVHSGSKWNKCRLKL